MRHFVHPTLGQVTIQGDESRLKHVVAGADNPSIKPDFAPIDIGSTNVDRYDRDAGAYGTDNLAYVNTIGTLQFFARRIRELGVKPALVSWAVPFTRRWKRSSKWVGSMSLSICFLA